MDPSDDLPPDLEDALRALARGQDARAAPLVEAARQALREAPPARRARAEDQLGWAFQRRGRHRDAERAFDAARAARDEDPEAEPLARAEGLARLAWARAIRIRQECEGGDFRGPRRLLREALAMQAEVLGAEHPRVRAARARLEAFERRRFPGEEPGS